jgi:hypothetical protein
MLKTDQRNYEQYDLIPKKYIFSFYDIRIIFNTCHSITPVQLQVRSTADLQQAYARLRSLSVLFTAHWLD